MWYQNKTLKFPLFWKFAIRMTIVVAIFGTINIFQLWSSVYQSFEKEIDKRCKVLAKIVSDKSVSALVYEDHLSLYNILDEVKNSDPSISYIFILNNSNELIAQTYDIRIPQGLLSANKLSSGNYNIEVINTDNFQYPVIRDIAYPILNGEIGVVRMGIVEEHIQQELMAATKKLLIMIVAFFVIGLFAALFFSYIITSPIKKISQKAQIIDLNSIDLQDHNIEGKKSQRFFNILVYDELDVLVTKFSEMLSRLKISYTELKETQESLVQAEKMASLGTLSAGVAHEINNPIFGIKNCANRIMKDPQNTEQTIKYIELINDATNKMEAVVSQLLKFSRKQDIVLERTDVNIVVKDSITLTKHKLESNKITINAIYDKTCIVAGSGNHLEQVIVNMILNSLDSIQERKENEPNHRGEIEINLKKQLKKVSICIKDNGNGIPYLIRDKIFDPFFTSKVVGKGTGLGLSVSFNLIKEHNGRIQFSSTEGSGTEFSIELPLYTKLI